MAPIAIVYRKMLAQTVDLLAFPASSVKNTAANSLTSQHVYVF